MTRIVVVLLSAIAIVLACGAGYLKWFQVSAEKTPVPRPNAYKADSVEEELGAASDRLTGEFKESYATPIRDVVVTGAKQRKISSIAPA
ncbi:hypothetical protein [Mycolicibacterium nivoides]|uniref:hypothetical protein n=1 Tax=Mycolicibacterium nivoides TaxID=2487344 RepID=UPI003C2DFEF9